MYQRKAIEGSRKALKMKKKKEMEKLVCNTNVRKIINLSIVTKEKRKIFLRFI